MTRGTDTFVRILSLLAMSRFCLGQVLIPGRCLDHPVVQNFNPDTYIGEWYEVEKFPTVFETGGKCNQAHYDLLENGTLTVYNTMILEDGTLSEIYGTAFLNSTDGSAKLAVNFPTTGGREAPYWVLDTDYENFALVWSCSNFIADTTLQFVWFLSRKPFPEPSIRFRVYSVLHELGIPLDSLRVTDQATCH